MAQLKAKTAVVTGASSGIGKAIAKSLAAEGAHVFVTGRSAKRLDETASEIAKTGGKVTAEAFDIREVPALQAFVARAAKDTGRLNVMVNAAGLEFPSSVIEGEPEHWRELLDTNVLALMVGSQAAVKAMRATKSDGHIVNISSIASQRDTGGLYAASKIAVNYITKTLRQELENEPIRPVIIMPGAVGTNFGRNFEPEFVNGFLKMLGLPATFKKGDVLSDSAIDALNTKASALFASPDDIARAVLYAVTQPIDLNVFEITVRPRKSLALPGQPA